MFGRNLRRKKKTKGEEPVKKKNKFNAQKVTIDGIAFDSGLEGDRYLVLKEALSKGEISDLRLHQTYELLPSQKIKVTEIKQLKTKVKVVEKEKTIFLGVKFTPDFVYRNKFGELIAEDSKGSKKVISRDFGLRQKMLYATQGIYVNIVMKANAPIGETKFASKVQ